MPGKPAGAADCTARAVLAAGGLCSLSLRNWRGCASFHALIVRLHCKWRIRMILTGKSRAPPFVAALALLLIAACAVGPNFKRPAAPDVSDYTASPLSSTVATANVSGGEAQHFAKGS